MDVLNLCRGCMKEVSSWEKENFDVRVGDMFSFCTNIRLADEDKLPQQFCYECTIKIESSYTFITEAQKVHVTLKNIISRSNTSIIIEPDKYAKPHKPEIKLTLPDYKICSVIEETKIYEPIKISAETNSVEVDENVETYVVVEVVNEKGENNEQVKVPEVPKNSNVCPVCRKSFTSKTWFAKHMQKEHVRKYTCPNCPKSFTRASQLKSHAVSHSEERKFACSACGARFKRRKQLSAHARAHDDARPYACDQCSAKFKTKSILKSHMSVHDKAFLCSFCGWSFAQAGNLKVHLRVHTGEKPYACARCPFRAAAGSALRRHARAHAGLRTHACARCGKLFHDSSNLARHMRVHTGALPYRCAWCACAFADSWKRKAHVMRAHRVPLERIPRMNARGELLQTYDGRETVLS